MIQDAMRKHRRIMMAVLLAFLIVPFVLWGGWSGVSSNNATATGEAVVAVVGDTPIPAETFAQQLKAQRQQMAQFGSPPPTPQQMLADGSAMKVLDNIVGSQLISELAKKSDYEFEQDYLVQKLKESPYFQDEQGKFDPKLWNDAVKSTQNWNALYAQEQSSLAYSLAVQRSMASARVLDADIRKQFEEQNTTFELKYVTIAPKIEPTEEQIKETYDQNTAAYNLPEKRRAEFVALSLVPAKPALADEIAKRARDGEDFEKLAKENSTAPSKDTGGDLGWLRDGPITSAHQKALFSMQKGQVSDPVYGPNGYYVFKVEDERTDAASNLREVKVREILIAADLSEEEYKAAQDKAKQIQEKAKANGDLAAAAAEASAEVKISGQFTIESLNIENVPDADARFFRSRLAAIGANEVAEPFEAQANIYVAKVSEVEAAVPQPLEAVRDKVVKDTISRLENSPEYRKQCDELAKNIQANAKSLQEIITQHPDLNATIQSIPPFTAKTYDFQKGPMWNPRDVIETAKSKEAGAMFGPVTDFMGKPHFVELVAKTPPDEKAWAEEWPKEEKQLREQALQMEQGRRLDDYVAYLREDMVNKGKYQVDQAAFIRALGVEQEQPAEAEAASDSVPAADGATAPTPAPATPDAAVPAETPATPAPAAAESISAAPADAATAPAAPLPAPAPGPKPAEVPPPPPAVAP
ncbi:MAG: peptidylprolyl isomerase [Candidatus Hydrogenedentes bacterium]|nr:peptidylprolyl isomerase [Candidatus Hydrogenedentota bacterium]